MLNKRPGSRSTFIFSTLYPSFRLGIVFYTTTLPPWYGVLCYHTPSLVRCPVLPHSLLGTVSCTATLPPWYGVLYYHTPPWYGGLYHHTSYLCTVLAFRLSVKLLVFCLLEHSLSRLPSNIRPHPTDMEYPAMTGTSMLW